MMSVKPPLFRLRAAYSSSWTKTSFGSEITPGLLTLSGFPSGTYATTGATNVLPSSRAIRSAVTLMMKLCFPITMCGPFCSVPPVAMMTDVVPFSIRSRISVQGQFLDEYRIGPLSLEGAGGGDHECQ